MFMLFDNNYVCKIKSFKNFENLIFISKFLKIFESQNFS